VDNFERIKKLVIIAMFSDDDLMDILVLKGGNAIDIIHNIALRSSIDVDFSIENEFSKDELEAIGQKIERTLKETFSPEGFEVFDVKFEEKPPVVTQDMAAFWGGYQVEFKIIENEKYSRLFQNKDALRKNATVVSTRNKRTFRIDISKFEYCRSRQEQDLNGFTIYVYTPEMIVFEKIRAICQQMPEYAQVVNNPSQSARARDFFDIYTILEHFKGIDFRTRGNADLLKNIFAAKRVPLNLIGKIKDYKEYHRPDFVSVKDTVQPSFDLREFDYYFDYVVDRCRELEPLWKV